jgi:hypothetical protein
VHLICQSVRDCAVIPPPDTHAHAAAPSQRDRNDRWIERQAAAGLSLVSPAVQWLEKLAEWRRYCNMERRCSALGNLKPQEYAAP